MSTTPSEKPFHYGSEDPTEYAESDSMAILQNFRNDTIFREPVFVHVASGEFYCKIAGKFILLDSNVENFTGRYEKKNPSAATLQADVIQAENAYAQALDSRHSQRTVEKSAVNLNHRESFASAANTKLNGKGQQS